MHLLQDQACSWSSWQLSCRVTGNLPNKTGTEVCTCISQVENVISSLNRSCLWRVSAWQELVWVYQLWMDLYRPGSIKQPDFQVLRGTWRLTVKFLSWNEGGKSEVSHCGGRKGDLAQQWRYRGLWYQFEATLLESFAISWCVAFLSFSIPNLLCLFRFLLFFYISGHTMCKVLIEASLVFMQVLI